MVEMTDDEIQELKGSVERMESHISRISRRNEEVYKLIAGDPSKSRAGIGEKIRSIDQKVTINRRGLIGLGTFFVSIVAAAVAVV